MLRRLFPGKRKLPDALLASGPDKGVLSMGSVRVTLLKMVEVNVFS